MWIGRDAGFKSHHIITRKPESQNINRYLYLVTLTTQEFWGSWMRIRSEEAIYFLGLTDLFGVSFGRHLRTSKRKK